MGNSEERVSGSSDDTAKLDEQLKRVLERLHSRNVEALNAYRLAFNACKHVSLFPQDNTAQMLLADMKLSYKIQGAYKSTASFKSAKDFAELLIYLYMARVRLRYSKHAEVEPIEKQDLEETCEKITELCDEKQLFSKMLSAVAEKFDDLTSENLHVVYIYAELLAFQGKNSNEKSHVIEKFVSLLEKIYNASQNKPIDEKAMLEAMSDNIIIACDSVGLFDDLYRAVLAKLQTKGGQASSENSALSFIADTHAKMDKIQHPTSLVV